MSVPEMEGANTVNFDAQWVSACTRVSALAHEKLPKDLHGRIERATALCINGGVVFEEDGTTCQVRGGREGRWYVVNGHCECEDFFRAPEGLCKHRLARKIYQRAIEVLREPVTLDLDTPAYTSHGFKPEHIVTIQGKPFVRVAGLLMRAYEEGLQTLTVQWTYNDAGLSLAQATATFVQGDVTRTFTECGDATPDNVTKMVKPHFRRVALTRAKARCLRDALGVDLVAVEELADEQ